MQNHENSKHEVLGISVEAAAHGKIHGGSMNLSIPLWGAAGAEIVDVCPFLCFCVFGVLF